MNDHAWAVATTLGHSNPDTVTLRHYVHCLDILLALFLESRTKFGAPSSPKQLRRISGLPRSTAFDWLPGSKAKCKSSTVSASGTDSDLNGSLLPESAKEFAIRVFSERLGLTIKTHLASLPLPGVASSWAKNTYDVLWMESELGLPAEQLATFIELDRRDIDAILSCANTILRHRGFQNISVAAQPTSASSEDLAKAPLVPRPPKISLDSESFSAWSAGIEEVVRKNSGAAAASLAYLHSNMLPKTAQVVFAGAPQKELMRFCLDMYEVFGFHRDGLNAITCDGTRHSGPSEQWLRDRGISRRIAAINQFGNRGLLGIEGPWVVVGPRSVKADKAQAIWFLTRMAAIRFSGNWALTS